MGDVPVRIQRKRSKGWVMPENTVYVGRPARFGNMFVVSKDADRLGHYADWRKNHDLLTEWPVPDMATAARAYRFHIRRSKSWCAEIKTVLRGKNLACWCALDQPCHADTLLEISNA